MLTKLSIWEKEKENNQVEGRIFEYLSQTLFFIPKQIVKYIYLPCSRHAQ
jgi:hypothetical protein